VTYALPIALFALGGVMLGGVLSLRRQGAPMAPTVVLGLLAVMAVAGGALQLIYGGG
jgi:hypothetical protein